MDKFLKKYWLLVLITIVLLMSSCDDPNDIDTGTLERHTIIMKVSLPSRTSKVPTCKESSPDNISLRIMNSDGELYEYISPLVDQGVGIYESTESFNLPTGRYIIESIELFSEGIPVYAVPDETDVSVHPYADIVLPMEINLESNIVLNSNVFCFMEVEEPTIGATIDFNMNMVSLRTLFVYIEDVECVDHIILTGDDGRQDILYPTDRGMYKFTFPDTYFMVVLSSFDDQGNNTENISLHFSNQHENVEYVTYECT